MDLSCDTLVAFSGDGRVVFGKNSDRPNPEPQPLEFVPGARHPSGATVRCQYLTIPQAPQTLGVLGSRPWWLWGFEHGVNTAGVVIGNEGLPVRDEVREVGLLGMDLVRLGLERGTNAEHALRSIVELLETYGQGGAATYPLGGTPVARYHNSFLIADAQEAFVLETSDRHWVYRRVTESTAIANLVTIEDNWDDASDGIETHARSQGWWSKSSASKLNFRLAFEDTERRLRVESRFGASCSFLARDRAVSVSAMTRHLRDHFEGGTVNIPDTASDPRPVSICVHPRPSGGATAASMVVELGADHTGPPIAWCSMATPCTGVFLPIQVGEPLPSLLTIADSTDGGNSLWWKLRNLQALADEDPQRRTPVIQSVLGPWEREMLVQTLANPTSVAAFLPARVGALLERVGELEERLRDSRATPIVADTASFGSEHRTASTQH